MAKRAKRPVGRPRKKHGPAKTVTLGLRVSGDLKAKVEAAGDKFGRTQSREAEHRLKLSFRTDDLGREMRLIMSIVASLEEARGTRWRDDLETCRSVVGLIEAFFLRFGPKGLAEAMPTSFEGINQRTHYRETLDGLLEIMAGRSPKELGTEKRKAISAVSTRRKSKTSPRARRAVDSKEGER